MLYTSNVKLLADKYIVYIQRDFAIVSIYSVYVMTTVLFEYFADFN